MNQETLDRQLEQRALREGWELPAKKRDEVLKKTYKRAVCGDPEIEEAATRTLILADALQLKKRIAEQKRIESEHARKLQCIELLVKLGAVVDDSGRTGSVDCIEANR